MFFCKLSHSSSFALFLLLWLYVTTGWQLQTDTNPEERMVVRRPSPKARIAHLQAMNLKATYCFTHPLEIQHRKRKICAGQSLKWSEIQF